MNTAPDCWPTCTLRSDRSCPSLPGGYTGPGSTKRVRASHRYPALMVSLIRTFCRLFMHLERSSACACIIVQTSVGPHPFALTIAENYRDSAVWRLLAKPLLVRKLGDPREARLGVAELPDGAPLVILSQSGKMPLISRMPTTRRRQRGRR